MCRVFLAAFDIFPNSRNVLYYNNGTGQSALAYKIEFNVMYVYCNAGNVARPKRIEILETVQ